MKTLVTIAIFALVLLNWGCRKNADQINSVIELRADAQLEKTTHIFVFSPFTKNPVPPTDKIYVRYNWESDSLWDTPFSQDQAVHHRFYVPGTYWISAEFLTQSGQLQKDSLQIVVEQGQSSPHPDFQVTPATGHFMTDFVFDASLSHDDEDSLESLQFRWDFYSDGVWETEFTNSPTTTFRFFSSGRFQVNLEVRDPSNRGKSVSHWVDVHRTDSLIHPLLEITPEAGSVVDTFLFDASKSFCEGDPDRELSYSWKFTNEGLTIPSKDSFQIRRIFERPGPLTVTLVVLDQNQLQNSITREFYVSLGNRPPTAFFETPLVYGNSTTQFYFTVWGSRDDQTAVTELQKRWDFDGDGIWDTEFSADMEFYHQYSKAGRYETTLQVKDQEGLTGKITQTISVSPYTNPTGFITDVRDHKLYGTVKIGKYWWMAENLDFRPDKKMELLMLHRCYNDYTSNCDKYGSLYLPDRVLDYNKSGKNICPEGWHVPTRAEMEDLGANLPKTNSREALEPGGSLDFNGQYSGYGSYAFVRNVLDEVVDTVWSYYNIDYEGYAASSDYKASTGRVFNLQFSKRTSEAWVFTYPGAEFYYPIRCVKD